MWNVVEFEVGAIIELMDVAFVDLSFLIDDVDAIELYFSLEDDENAHISYKSNLLNIFIVISFDHCLWKLMISFEVVL
jgi:hypothetical protein